MSKITDFYTAVLGNVEAKKELASILEGKELENATDKQLEKIGALAERLGYKIALSEARDFFQKSSRKLSEDELDAVAGGKGERIDRTIYVCDVGGQAGLDDDNFGAKAKPVTRGYKH